MKPFTEKKWNKICSCPKKKEIVGDSVITPSTGRGFAIGFFLGHLWDVLLR